MTTIPVLIDARTPEEVWVKFEDVILGAPFVGLDIETEDSRRHQGLNTYCGYDPKTGKKKTKGKLVFDINRTTVCGISFHPDGSEYSYYVNLAHADVENRVPFGRIRNLLDRIQAPLLVHNAPFELVMMKNALGYELKNVICTLQMCVSAYGPDEYDVNEFRARGLEGMRVLIPEIISAYRGYDGSSLDEAQEDVLNKVIGKQSKAAHSYNGYVKEIAYGYGLKEAVKSWFGYEMATYDDTLGDKAHMGQLTGDEVVAYGADDAYWCVRLFHRVYQFMLDTNPQVFETFIKQENPMIHVYADVWRNGMKVNIEAIAKRRDLEREILADKLRELKAAVRACLPFPAEPNEKLTQIESWYEKNWHTYRSRIQAWALSEDSSDPYQQCVQTAGSLQNVWMKEVDGKKPTGPNLTHYMMARTLYYDLLGLKTIVIDGKVQSDAECRGRLLKRAENEAKTVINLMAELSSIDQRMKAYITPYLQLTDPETGRVYPVLSSKLATRRMATQYPNTLALAKKGESVFVRGFFEADDENSLIVSIDWSSIELVQIGDEFGDPEFAKCFSKIPYDDLHAGAAADAIGVKEDDFKALSRMSDEVNPGFPLVLPDGTTLTPKSFYKEMRTKVGKGSNFNYWYSGALSSVGEMMGWSSEQMWEATERYRERFAVAEEWRVNTIAEGQMNGFVELRDGHRRVRYEATPAWREHFLRKFEQYGEPVQKFAQLVAKRIQSRANNQIVNAKIQGGCATLAKRSIRRIVEDELNVNPYWAGCRFMLPIHDELVSSVKKDRVIPYIRMAKKIMADHKELIRTLLIDATASVGRTFEPYHPEKAPFGQIEIDEAPKLQVLSADLEGQRLQEPDVQKVLDYLEAA